MKNPKGLRKWEVLLSVICTSISNIFKKCCTLRNFKTQDSIELKKNLEQLIRGYGDRPHAGEEVKNKVSQPNSIQSRVLCAFLDILNNFKQNIFLTNGRLFDRE